VGEDPASQVYVGKKEKTSNRLGFAGRTEILSVDTTQEALLARLAGLNDDDDVDGILVQLPLPPQISAAAVIQSIRPDKDVDGFHPQNLGHLFSGSGQPLVACTPRGIMRLLDETGVACQGAEVVVIGRSTIVGKPLALLLLARHATVTICHSRTVDLARQVGRADILVSAVGHPELVKGDWIKPGATVIDVGTNRTEAGKLVGDIEYEAAAKRAAWITPVPGGVGPMTVASLMENTLLAARRRLGEDV
jgi:methylenetetrahydrofolate dehydrogenase (NADP+)/methenyltetrahydrofolate cyclohydrolase